MAAFYDNPEAVKMFLVRDDFKFNNNVNWHALVLAAQEGHANVAHLLIAMGGKKPGFDINAQDAWGHSALHRAADGGFESILEDVLSFVGVECNMVVSGRGREAAGKTALIFATENMHTGCTRILLAHPKVNPNFPENVEFPLCFFFSIFVFAIGFCFCAESSRF